MFCTKCGAENVQGNRFCSNCGVPLHLALKPKVHSPILAFVSSGFILLVLVASLLVWKLSAPQSESTVSLAESICRFVGIWEGVGPNAREITHVEVRSESDKIFIHIWGKYQGRNHDWDETQATVAGDSLSITWKADFGTETQEFNILPNGNLQIKGTIHRTDKAGLPDFNYVAELRAAGDTARDCPQPNIASQSPTPATGSEKPSLGAIKGRVFDKETGKPIPNVRIAIFDEESEQSLRNGITTNDQGEFQLQDIEPGTYRITLSPATRDHEPVEQYITVQVGETTTFDVPLSTRLKEADTSESSKPALPGQETPSLPQDLDFSEKFDFLIQTPDGTQMLLSEYLNQRYPGQYVLLSYRMLGWPYYDKYVNSLSEEAAVQIKTWFAQVGLANLAVDSIQEVDLYGIYTTALARYIQDALPVLHIPGHTGFLVSPDRRIIGAWYFSDQEDFLNVWNELKTIEIHLGQTDLFIRGIESLFMYYAFSQEPPDKYYLMSHYYPAFMEQYYQNEFSRMEHQGEYEKLWSQIQTKLELFKAKIKKKVYLLGYNGILSEYDFDKQGFAISLAQSNPLLDYPTWGNDDIYEYPESLIAKNWTPSSIFLKVAPDKARSLIEPNRYVRVYLMWKPIRMDGRAIEVCVLKLVAIKPEAGFVATIEPPACD